MGRKTIEVAKLLKIANTALSADSTPEDSRAAVCSFIETVLFETSNYEGFKYLNSGCHYTDTRREYFANNTTRSDN